MNSVILQDPVVRVITPFQCIIRNADIIRTLCGHTYHLCRWQEIYEVNREH